MGLFRQEALESRRNRLQGQVVLLPRWPHALLCIFLTLWVAAVAAFLNQASYSRKETVRGWLEPAGGIVRIFPQSPGRVASLLVAPGDAVQRGQPLLIVNGDRMLADGSKLEGLLLDEYQSQVQSLGRQIDRQAELFEHRDAELRARVASARKTLDNLEQQSITLARRHSLAQQRLDRHRLLADSGHITMSELEALEEQGLLLTAEHQQLQVQRHRQQALLRQLQAERARVPRELEDTRDRLSVALSELTAQIVRLRGNRAHVITAPVSGRINSIGVALGQRADVEHPLITLLPTDAPIQATLLAPVHAAGFLAEGQALRIRYDAFPYQKFGIQEGEITAVTAGTVLPADQAYLPMAVSGPVFRVTARPTADAIKAHGSDFQLRAGMTLSADIILENRSLLQWLLEPLYGLRGKMT
jgi:membrane fusion protein